MERRFFYEDRSSGCLPYHSHPPLSCKILTVVLEGVTFSFTCLLFRALVLPLVVYKNFETASLSQFSSLLIRVRLVGFSPIQVKIKTVPISDQNKNLLSG